MRPRRAESAGNTGRDTHETDQQRARHREEFRGPLAGFEQRGLRKESQPPAADRGDPVSAILRYDKHIEKLAEEKYPATQRLRSIRGVGPITSLAFVLNLDNDPQRLGSSRDAGWGCGPSAATRASLPQLSITKVQLIDRKNSRHWDGTSTSPPLSVLPDEPASGRLALRNANLSRPLRAVNPFPSAGRIPDRSSPWQGFASPRSARPGLLRADRRAGLI